jgi:hypothetical protein
VKNPRQGKTWGGIFNFLNMNVQREDFEKKSAPIKWWLNRNVFAIGLTSFLSDFCHEIDAKEKYN